VYQGLIAYNGSSVTSFVGVLAQNNWTHTADQMTWNFSLRPGAHFSNGDPYNAYVQWYSLYRSLVLEQGPQFILEQNFFSPNLTAGTPPLTYYSSLSDIQAANATLLNDLNTWDFSNPSASAVTAMGLPGQSFRVLSPSEIQLNLGNGYLGQVPYNYLFASLGAPTSYAVDPIVVDANGGIQEGQVNTYLATSMVGTGPYVLQSFSPEAGGGYLLAPDSNYWGISAHATEPWNVMIQPANTSVQVVFQDSLDITVNDLGNGAVQSASFAYVGPSTVQALQGKSNVVVQPLSSIYGATGGSWWIYLNQSVAPFDNLSVRQAVAHAIHYAEIIQQAFGGYASQWVGPVPPDYPYYNPQNLAPYSYDLALAQQEIANSPCASNACQSMHISYAYLDTGLDWSETAQFIVADLAKIGLTITPVPISLDNLYTEQSYSNGACVTATAANGGPFYMGQEFYTSDYISPDDWTQNNAYSGGSANKCMSGFSNATVDTEVYAAASDLNPTNLTGYYTDMTKIMYDNYSEIWLVVPTAFNVYTTNLHGFINNPMGSAEPYVLQFNTMWLS
ncbi:MAG: ABC transporter substrate-binding protein, partial [Thermoplasmata archaeon]|nr:ABC transporter substrate-binding protein [Thermoplasmata archaeon]